MVKILRKYWQFSLNKMRIILKRQKAFEELKFSHGYYQVPFGEIGLDRILIRYLVAFYH